VVFVLTQSRGGPVDLTVGLAREIAGRVGGPEVRVIGPNLESSAGDVGDLLVPVTIASKGDTRGARELRRQVHEASPWIVHAQDRRAALFVASVARPRAPVVVTMHGVPDGAARWWVQGGPLHHQPVAPGAAAVLMGDALIGRVVDAVVAPSQTMARFLRDRLRIPARRIEVITNGVAPRDARPLADRARVYISVGSFAAIKGMRSLLRAFAEVVRTHPDVELRLIGDGDERAACERLVAELGFGAHVEFAGYRLDVAEQLRLADVFVLPSLNENLPLALLEAMATGLACVAADVGAVREALRTGAGLVVPPGDERALAAALARLADEPGLGARLGGAAAAAAAQFTTARAADEHLALWRSLTTPGANIQRP